MKGTQSLERAVHILRLFDDERPDWSLQELIEQTGLTKTTVFRMLTTLKHEGFLEQTEKGKWIYGFLIGFIGMIIRILNPAYPEGWMLAILFLNTFAALIDHFVIEANISRRLKRA